jgi:hypothetical protein
MVEPLDYQTQGSITVQRNGQSVAGMLSLGFFALVLICETIAGFGLRMTRGGGEYAGLPWLMLLIGAPLFLCPIGFAFGLFGALQHRRRRAFAAVGLVLHLLPMAVAGLIYLTQ